MPITHVNIRVTTVTNSLPEDQAGPHSYMYLIKIQIKVHNLTICP